MTADLCVSSTVLHLCHYSSKLIVATNATAVSLRRGASKAEHGAPNLQPIRYCRYATLCDHSSSLMRTVPDRYCRLVRPYCCHEGHSIYTHRTAAPLRMAALTAAAAAALNNMCSQSLRDQHSAAFLLLSRQKLAAVTEVTETSSTSQTGEKHCELHSQNSCSANRQCYPTDDEPAFTLTRTLKRHRSQQDVQSISPKLCNTV
eukprot:6290-Heterococcus_DN1.PRE.6